MFEVDNERKNFVLRILIMSAKKSNEHLKEKLSGSCSPYCQFGQNKQFMMEPL